MASVVVVGAGAIGSHLLPLLVWLPNLTRLTIIDRDRYDAGNLRGQQIDGRDVGRSKARVQARRLRRVNRALEIVPIRAAIEHVPLGRLRGSLILAALDSSRARMVVNQVAFRLGIPWVDAGVHADGMLAHARVFVPATEAPCLECAWDQADYDALDQSYPCAEGVIPGSTGAPAALGALAAALQAIECDKLLSGDARHSLVGRDVLIDARHHIHTVTSYRRNPSCRMPDHEGWQIAPLGAAPDGITVGELLAQASTLRGASASLALGIAGQRLATELSCEACEASQSTCLTERLARRRQRPCRRCGGRLHVTGFGLRDFAPEAAIAPEVRDQPLSAIGVRAYDVLTFRTPELDAHYEVRTR